MNVNILVEGDALLAAARGGHVDRWPDRANAKRWSLDELSRLFAKTKRVVASAEGAVEWVDLALERCPCCKHMVADTWRSSLGHELRFEGTAGFRGYGPDGSRVMKNELFDTIEAAQAELLRRAP